MVLLFILLTKENNIIHSIHSEILCFHDSPGIALPPADADSCCQCRCTELRHDCTAAATCRAAMLPQPPLTLTLCWHYDATTMRCRCAAAASIASTVADAALPLPPIRLFVYLAASLVVVMLSELDSVFLCSPWYVPNVACWREISVLFPGIGDLCRSPPFLIIMYKLIWSSMLTLI